VQYTLCNYFEGFPRSNNFYSTVTMKPTNVSKKGNLVTRAFPSTFKGKALGTSSEGKMSSLLIVFYLLTSPLLTIESPVAQWLEHWTRGRVVGNKLIWSSDFFPSWQNFSCCFKPGTTEVLSEQNAFLFFRLSVESSL